MTTDNPDGCERKLANGLQSTFTDLIEIFRFEVSFSDFCNLLILHIYAVWNYFLWLRCFVDFRMNFSDFCVTGFK